MLFDGGKGKSVLSPHHLACVESPVLKDLFVGCRVVACYEENGQSWLHAAVVAEMPDRKNRMRCALDARSFLHCFVSPVKT